MHYTWMQQSRLHLWRRLFQSLFSTLEIKVGAQAASPCFNPLHPLQ